jgi:quinol-cytochrome oxidoreductase complex cytochrome b subunit
MIIIIIIIIILFFLVCPWSDQETVRSWASQPYAPHHLTGRSPPVPSV